MERYAQGDREDDWDEVPEYSYVCFINVGIEHVDQQLDKEEEDHRCIDGYDDYLEDSPLCAHLLRLVGEKERHEEADPCILRHIDPVQGPEAENGDEIAVVDCFWLCPQLFSIECVYVIENTVDVPHTE